ncbi:WcbI family polysaccharide biosynthesis putative acetyltransferase, partial [Azospirillum sp. B506]|uniref:WcbI family polysaccharide biosynthesis putative acetyltransferase n=1 Tax=Azospirillum sp. B506 TaxID=137721 RepID=UPI0011DD98BD
MLNILIYANCQGGAVAKFISPIISESHNVSIKHRNSYESVLMYRESGYTGNEVPEDFREDLQQADVFIYQPLKAKYGVLSTERRISDSVLNMISGKCLPISIPYAYNTALWPIYADDKSMRVNNSIVRVSKNASSFSDIEELYWNGN